MKISDPILKYHLISLVNKWNTGSNGVSRADRLAMQLKDDEELDNTSISDLLEHLIDEIHNRDAQIEYLERAEKMRKG